MDILLTGSILRGSRSYALRYDSLHQPGQGLAFPCDEDGHIDMDTMPERARNNYFAARALVGREFACPVVELLPLAA